MLLIVLEKQIQALIVERIGHIGQNNQRFATFLDSPWPNLSGLQSYGLGNGDMMIIFSYNRAVTGKYHNPRLHPTLRPQVKQKKENIS